MQKQYQKPNWFDMKTFGKRIYFLVSSQNLGPHGGVGTFFSGFAAFCEKHNYKLDLILDTNPREIMHEILTKWPTVDCYCPNDALSYNEHNKWCAFSKERTNTEKILNFQKSMRMAMQNHLPDCIISNAPESNHAVLNDGWHYLIPTVFYTHLDHTVHWNMDHGIVPFHPSMTDSLQRTLLNPKIYVGTQTQKNVEIIQGHMKQHHANVVCLPLICEQQFWHVGATTSNQNQGILFIGRYEPRKNPELFLKTFEQFNAIRLREKSPLVPARVLTNKTGEAKWRSEFANINIPNLEYHIAHSLTGENKINFIKQARIALITSKLESFGYAALEALHFVPTILLSNYAWTQNFVEYGATLVDQSQLLDKVMEIYNCNQPHFPKTQNYHTQADQAWHNFIENVKSDKKSNGASRIYKTIEESKTPVCYKQFFKKQLQRNIITHTDIEGAIAAKNSFCYVHTAHDTYIMKHQMDLAQVFSQSFDEHHDDDLWNM